MADDKPKPGTIDIALADTIANKHWLDPAEKHKHDPRLLAIRQKNRDLHKARQKMDALNAKMDKAAKKDEP
jgi:hypothetical protein